MSSVTYVWNVTGSYDSQINNLNMLKGRRGESCYCIQLESLDCVKYHMQVLTRLTQPNS
jgi:hypothetical protein